MAHINQAIPRVAVIGCGRWGKNLVRNFASLGALAAVCDSDVATATRFSTEFGAPALDTAELFADDGITAVAIAAPPTQHFPLAKAALEAGKHVFVEKPLALDAEHGATLCALADSCGLTLMVGHLLQYHPAFLRLKELVDAGDVGRLQYIYSHRLNLGVVRREENILWSFAPHDISMILSLVGHEPDQVSAVGASYLNKSVADVTTTHLGFPNGEQAHIFVSWLNPIKEQKLVVVGEAGMVVFDDTQPWGSKILHYPHRMDWVDGQPIPNKADAVAVPVEQDEPLKLECRHFLDCVANGKRPRTDGVEGLKVLRVLQQAQQSLGLS